MLESNRLTNELLGGALCTRDVVVPDGQGSGFVLAYSVVKKK